MQLHRATDGNVEVAGQISKQGIDSNYTMCLTHLVNSEDFVSIITVFTCFPNCFFLSFSPSADHNSLSAMNM